LENYHRFKAAFAQVEERLVTVECVFGSQDFVLSGRNLIRVRATDVMWQKERLLNIAISQLPSKCQKVAWLDCDILFQNPAWLLQASRLLDNFALVQPFQKVIYMEKGDRSGSGDLARSVESFGSVFSSGSVNHMGGGFWDHGHTGFAWAARRDLFARLGLYDACVAGDGDHMIAHASYGDWDGPCVHRSIIGSRHREHFQKWAAEFYRAAEGRITYAPGALLHLWHPKSLKSILRKNLSDFDPAVDIKVGAGGALEWNSDKPELHRSLREYFGSKKKRGLGNPQARS
jgi:hypothetical protein